MQTFRPFHSAPRKGLTNAVLGRMMGHAIICLAVAGFVLCDSSRSSVWADQPAWELTQDEALLDEPALERSTIQFCLTENAAPADAGEHTLGRAIDYTITPVKFAYQEDAGQIPSPSYLKPDQAQEGGEKSPQPSYLEDGNENLSVGEQLELLAQRLDELEAAKIASEDATRTIIRRSFAERGSNITDAVVFGGTLETLTFWQDDFDDVSESDIILDTAELDFEITVNEWVLGSLVFEYFDGTDTLFQTAEGDEFFVDRINVRQAFITIGNTANYPLFMTTGRDVVPFGISTGDPVADVLTIIDPLTVEIFETTEDFIMFGFEGPTCCPPPAPTTPIPAPPPPRPMLFNPLARRAATCLCSYCPCYPPVPPAPLYLPPPTCLPPFMGAVYFYNGDTFNSGEDHIEHMGGTLGYRTRGNFRGCTPWTMEYHVDVNSSVFDSNFLAFEYFPFLDQIGYVPGMASYIRSSFGPFALVAEWNGALNDANFDDGADEEITIRPEAWQVSLAYQLDWNRYVEVIGAQGTYLVASYSESKDLAGVTKSFGDPITEIRVGNVPERRLSAGVGEWVLDGLRIAFEYSHAWDYDEGLGTGNTADGVFMQVTYEW